MPLAHALAALIAAYVPLRLACTAVAYCREQQGHARRPDRWSRAIEWITRHPNLFPRGRRLLTAPAALCLVPMVAIGAARLFM